MVRLDLTQASHRPWRWRSGQSSQVELSLRGRLRWHVDDGRGLDLDGVGGGRGWRRGNTPSSGQPATRRWSMESFAKPKMQSSERSARIEKYFGGGRFCRNAEPRSQV